jgi:hypothetical protein
MSNLLFHVTKQWKIFAMHKEIYAASGHLPQVALVYQLKKYNNAIPAINTIV